MRLRKGESVTSIWASVQIKYGTSPTRWAASQVCRKRVVLSAWDLA